MRKKGIKWVIGTLSIVAVAFAVVVMSNSSHAQDDEGADKVKIENTQDTPSADMDSDNTLKVRGMDCSNGCDPEKCETECTPEECESFCKSIDAGELIEEGDC